MAIPNYHPDCQFCSCYDDMPSCPARPDMDAHRNWHIWRNLCDRIVSRSDYRFGHPNVRLLLRLVDFAGIQMTIYNNKQWGTKGSDVADFTGRFDGHSDRATDRAHKAYLARR